MVMNFITRASFQYHAIHILNQRHKDTALAINNNINKKLSPVTNNSIKVDNHSIVSPSNNFTPSNVNTIKEPISSNNNTILKDTKNAIKRSNENNKTLDEFI